MACLLAILLQLSVSEIHGCYSGSQSHIYVVFKKLSKRTENGLPVNISTAVCGILLFISKFRLLCSRQNKTSNQKKMKNVVAFATSFYRKVFMQMQYFGIRQEDKK